ncbi:autotransporter outer membrane beta-barrel domain-containing protein, partial [Komagataeibacter swingsii]
TLAVGGANGIVDDEGGAGTYAFNLSGGTLKVIGSDLTTAIDPTLAGGTTSTIDVSQDNATFSGSFLGAGNLATTGGGTVTLTGTTGGIGRVTVEGGSTLAVSGEAGSLTAAGITVGTSNGGTVTVENGGTIISDGAIAFGDGAPVAQGSMGTLNVDAGGTLAVGGANGIVDDSGTYVFNLSGGTLRDIGSNLTSSMDMTLSNTSTLDTNGLDTTLSGILSGDGALKKTGAGILVLDGANSFSGGSTIAQGEVMVGQNTALGSGSVTMAQGTTLGFTSAGLNIANNVALSGRGDPTIDTGTYNETLSGDISGAGDLTKAGSGTLVLTGDDNGLTGMTDIADGTLQVDGSLASSAITVGMGTTLSGNGTVGGTTVSSGGTLSPGDGAGLIGTLTVNGDLTVNNGSTYVVDAVAPGQNDLVSVTGSARLLGGTVDMDVTSSTRLAYGQRYTVMTASGGVSGQFSTLQTNLASDYAFLTPTLAYDADDVFIELERNATGFSSVAGTRNESAAASALDSMTGAATGDKFYTSLMQLDGTQARHALNALSGELHASARTAVIQDAFYVRDAAIERLRAASCDPGAGSSTMKTADGHGHRNDGTCNTQGVTLWMQGYGGWGHDSGDGNAAGMDHSVGGFVMGADTGVFNNWRVGGMVGYGRSSFSVDPRGSYGHSNNISVGGYAGTHWGHLALRMGASYTWNLMSMNRTAAFQGYSDKLTSQYNGGTAQAFGELGYRFDLGRTAVEPFANVAYVNLHTNGYRERGGDAALRGQAMDTGVTYSTFGLRVSSAFRAGKVLLIPNATIGYRHAFGEILPTANQSFVSGGDEFSVAGVALSGNVALVNVGLRAKITDRMSFGASYIGQYGNRSIDNGLRGNFYWKF